MLDLSQFQYVTDNFKTILVKLQEIGASDNDNCKACNKPLTSTPKGDIPKAFKASNAINITLSTGQINFSKHLSVCATTIENSVLSVEKNKTTELKIGEYIYGHNACLLGSIMTTFVDLGDPVFITK